MDQRLTVEEIRTNERQSHTQLYTDYALYQDGSWLKKPVATVTKLFPYFLQHPQLRVLDLGCGVGRNAIAIADFFHDRQCHIDCVDLLEIAIDKLQENAAHYHVSSSIHTHLTSIDTFAIEENNYDWIIAVSALEHVAEKRLFLEKLEEIRKGIRNGGIVCLIINTEVREYHPDLGTPLPVQFEVNLSTQELLSCLSHVFSGWEIIKCTTASQHYTIPRSGFSSKLHTNVVTFVAKK